MLEVIPAVIGTKRVNQNSVTVTQRRLLQKRGLHGGGWGYPACSQQRERTIPITKVTEWVGIVELRFVTHGSSRVILVVAVNLLKTRKDVPWEPASCQFLVVEGSLQEQGAPYHLVGKRLPDQWLSRSINCSDRYQKLLNAIFRGSASSNNLAGAAFFILVQDFSNPRMRCRAVRAETCWTETQMLINRLRLQAHEEEAPSS